MSLDIVVGKPVKNKTGIGRGWIGTNKRNLAGKPKSLGSRGSMVPKLKLEGIHARAKLNTTARAVTLAREAAGVLALAQGAHPRLVQGRSRLTAPF